MFVYGYKRNKWSRSHGLWEELSLDGLVGKDDPTPYVIALTGAGGKTSFIRRLAWEGAERGFKVLVTTTTHMARPGRFGVFVDQVGEVKSMLDSQSVAVVGRMAQESKIASVEPDFYEKMCPLAHLVLVEADGSKRLPLKVPRPGEPVIPGNTDMILCVSGLTALGHPAVDKCCRLDYASGIMEEHGRRDYMDEGQWVITPEDMECLMLHGYLKPLRAMYRSVQVIPVWNQADTSELAELAGRMMKNLQEDQGIGAGMLHQDASAALF